MKVASEISRILRDSGVNFFAMLPCEKVAELYDLVSKNFKHVYLSREEEGVGICGGAYLAGAKPAILIQSSGLGNMINALCSLTRTYQMPLLIIASWRGGFGEKVSAQIPLGKSVPKLLDALDISYTIIENAQDLPKMAIAADEAYKNNKIHVLLLKPELMAKEAAALPDAECELNWEKASSMKKAKIKPATSTRFEILKSMAPYLTDKIVVCNIGIPSKELYKIMHQKSNFYMLGSMGLASSIGLGISLFTSKEVVVIDGDGSLLMNLGTLTTIAKEKPSNLTILAIDNGVYGSTGNQLTATSFCADLEAVARGSGFRNTYKETNPQLLLSTLQNLGPGPNFVHIRAKVGNAQVPNVPLTPEEIRDSVIEAIAA